VLSIAVPCIPEDPDAVFVQFRNRGRRITGLPWKIYIGDPENIAHGEAPRSELRCISKDGFYPQETSYRGDFRPQIHLLLLWKPLPLKLEHNY
jgi:hypothetical protein